jgi:phosphoglycolate phosphatase-like HAD superfamily hydrolase
MSSSPSPPDRPPLRGVIFDMDGTLTVPNHDFKRMYERVGCVTSDILTEIDTWEPARRERAEAIIHEMETEALVGMRVMPHASSLGAFLDERDVPRGLVTRNVSASVDHFHAEHWGRPEFGHERSSKQGDERRSTSVSSSGSLGLKPFSPALARDFRPFKPAPDALLHICAAWGVPPSACAMVGDSAKDDVVAGNRAGCVTILLDTQGKWRVEGETSADEPRGDGGEIGDDNGVAIGKETGDDVLRGEMVPTHVVRCLSEIAPLLERHYEIVGR